MSDITRSIDESFVRQNTWIKTIVLKKRKNFSVEKFFVIGVKPGRCFSMREDGKAVKMGLWVVEKEQEKFLSPAYLPALNRLIITALMTSRNTQGERESLPMQRNTAKPKEPGDITNARRAPVRQKTSISDIYIINGIQGIHSFLPTGAFFFRRSHYFPIFPQCHFSVLTA